MANLTPRMKAGLHRLALSAANGYTIGWGTFNALRRRGLAVHARRYDFVRLTPEGRRIAKQLNPKRA